MSFLETSPDFVRCTTPVTPITDRCPDAPLGARQPDLYYPHPRRSSSPKAKRRDRPRQSSSPRRLQPTPGITAMSLFTTFAFAEVEKERNEMSRSCQARPIRRRLNRYSTASELEYALESVRLEEHTTAREHHDQSSEYPRSVKTKRMRDLIELDQNVPDHEDGRVGNDERGVSWNPLSVLLRYPSPFSA
ncbi:hypothetical protein DFH28DRAFT_1082296 [Melampsora americana]|nr:hypothetical protein DFH28DRAFT_1082296 [Melampsora americana]